MTAQLPTLTEIDSELVDLRKVRDNLERLAHEHPSHSIWARRDADAMTVRIRSLEGRRILLAEHR